MLNKLHYHTYLANKNLFSAYNAWHRRRYIHHPVDDLWLFQSSVSELSAGSVLWVSM